MCHNTLLDGWLCSCQLIYWTWSICQKEKVWTGGSCLIVSICLISWVLPTDLESKVLYSKSSKLMHFRDVATFNNECATNIILVVSNIVIFGALLWSWTLIPKKWPVKRTGCERVLVWLMSILKFYLQVLKNTCFMRNMPVSLLLAQCAYIWALVMAAIFTIISKLDTLIMTWQVPFLVSNIAMCRNGRNAWRTWWYKLEKLSRSPGYISILQNP